MSLLTGEWGSYCRVIERSAGRGDAALMTIRRALATALRESVERSGIDWQDRLVHDLGDGLRVTAPAGTRKAALIHPLVHEFAARLRAHNRLAGPSTVIRVRVALHAGDLRIDPGHGPAGRPLEVLARLLDAPAVRAALAAEPVGTVAAVVLSEHFHEETVPHGYPGIDPEAFQPVPVEIKEFSARCWLALARPPAAAERSGGREATGVSPGRGEPAPRHEPSHGDPARIEPSHGDPSHHDPSRMVNKASGHGVINAVQHGTQHITTTRP